MLSSTTPTHTSLLPQFGVSAWECSELTAAITRGIINNVKALIFDGLGIIIYRLSYEIFILRCSPFFFFDSLATCCFCFSRWRVRLVISSTGTHFLFLFLFSFVFFFSFLNAVRCKKPYRCTICCFVFLYNVRASATCRLLNVFQLRYMDIHFFFWYCKERAYSSDAVFAEYVFHTSWPFFRIIFLVCFRTLEAFWERRFRLIILATLQWLQLLPCGEKCFWNKWKKKKK